MSISFKSLYYEGYPLSNKLYSKKMKQELTQSAHSIVLRYGKIADSLKKEEIQGVLRDFELNYSNGLINLNIIGNDKKGKSVHKNLILDIVNTNFFLIKLLPELKSLQRKSEKIENFISRLESTPCYEEVQKISEVYFSILKKYIHSYEGDEGGSAVNPIYNFSSYLFCSKGVKSFFQLRNPILFTTPAIGDISLVPKNCKFYKLIIKSLYPCLAKNNTEISIVFLQYAISQKSNFEEKTLFLKQVLFMSLFKCALYSILESLEDQIVSSACLQENSNKRTQLEYIRNSLSKFSVSDLLLLIPLSSRSLPIDKDNLSFFVSEEFVKEQINRAKGAYDVFIKVFVDHFGFSHETLGAKFSSELTEDKKLQVAKIHRFIKALSSMAISGGPFGRTAFYTYCLENEDDLCENLPLELVITAAQHYSLEDNWLEESYLGYISKIFGKISLSDIDIDIIRDKMQKITNFVHTIPMENLLRKNKQGEDILAKNVIDKFKDYYLQGCKSLNMQLIDRDPEVLCSIS